MRIEQGTHRAEETASDVTDLPNKPGAFTWPPAVGPEAFMWL